MAPGVPFSLARRDYEDALPVHRNEDVVVVRIDRNRVDPRALEASVFNKRFGIGVDYAHHSGGSTRRGLRAGSSMREVRGI
jgi:hypothetical protein